MRPDTISLRHAGGGLVERETADTQMTPDRADASSAPPASSGKRKILIVLGKRHVTARARPEGCRS